MQQEIQLPGNDSLYRAFADDAAMRFEPVAMPSGLKRIALYFLLMFALLPLGGYATMALWLLREGELMPWVVHLLGLGFGLLSVATLGYHALDNHRFRSSTVVRRANGALELHYARTRGHVRVYTLEEPVCLMAVLHQESGGSSGWRKVKEENGATHRERFADHVTIGLYLKGASTSPRTAFQPKGWLKLLPDDLDLHHKHYVPEQNLALTVAALGPLAKAFKQTLSLKARYHVAGRGAVHLDSFHGDAPIIKDGPEKI